MYHPYSRRMFKKGKLSAKGQYQHIETKDRLRPTKGKVGHSALFFILPCFIFIAIKDLLAFNKGMINNNKTKCPRNITVSRIIWAGAWCLEYPPCQHFCFEPFESCEHVHWCQLESCNHILREPVFVILRHNERHPNLQLGSVCFCLSKTEPPALS